MEEGQTPGLEHSRGSEPLSCLGIEGELDREGEGLFDKSTVSAPHEVIIERHNTRRPWPSYRKKPWKMCCGPIGTAFGSEERQTTRYILIFKNHGEAQDFDRHPHSQLIALPIVPRRVRER